MRTLGSRRAVLVAGAAAVAITVLAGCSAGQVAETSLKRPSDMGVNQDNSDGSVGVRNLAVVYNGPDGYAGGANAPLQLGLYNQTTRPITVTVSSARPTDGTDVGTNGTANSVVLTGGTASAAPADASAAPGAPSPSDSASAAPADSASAAPAAPAGGPAKITIAPMGSASFLPGDPQTLQLMGLTQELRPGQAVYVTFTFDNGAQPLTVAAPVGVPFSPASRGPGIPDENVESD